jgi:hypothetical protein
VNRAPQKHPLPSSPDGWRASLHSALRGRELLYGRRSAPSKQKVPLRHRQLVDRLAHQKLAVGPNVIGLGIDFDMSDKGVSIMPNSSPSGETLAKAILSSFGRALKDFDDFWHAGWDRPAHERACVAKLAADVTSQFSQSIEPWCEVSMYVLCSSKGLTQIPIMPKTGPVDLVLCNPSKNSITALIEFKTYHATEDTEKLIKLQDLLEIPTAVVVACQGVRFSGDSARTATELDKWIQTSLKETPTGWHSAVDPDRPSVNINGSDGGVWLARPFVIWRSISSTLLATP